MVTPVAVFKGGVGEAANMSMDLRENFHIFCSVVIYPVVPKDVIMFRIIPTAVHTLAELRKRNRLGMIRNIITSLGTTG